MNKKSWATLLSIVGGVLAGTLIAVHPHHPPAPPVDHTAQWQRACADIYLQELGREIDPSGEESCVALAAQGAQDADLRAWIRASEEYRARQEATKAPVVPPLLPLRADGRIFRTADGQPWRWKGVSAFQLLDRFAKGQSVDDFLEAYRGYNVLRVWPYVPAKDWGASAWDAPDADTIRRFLAAMAAKGWRVELTLLTDDDPSRLAWAKALVPRLTLDGCPPGLLMEAGNEPTTHKAIDTAALRGVLEASGCLYASGDYEDARRWYGSYATDHTPRRSDWPRFSHDLMEFFSGAGPEFPWTGAHTPVVADEPPKPADVGMTPADVRAYFGGAALFGAGATWHCDTCRFGQPPRSDEAALAAVALEALNAFPADAPLGGYRRLVEPGQSDSARTYAIGPYMVRSQQRGTAAPEPGWSALDADGILWRK